MKLKIIYKLSILAFLAILFQSRSSGPATAQMLQVTGAPGSTGSPGTCANAGCHSSGAFDPSLNIELLLNDEAVTEYIPGESYTLRVSISDDGDASTYGFQATARTADNTTAGSIAPESGSQVSVVSSFDYWEHTAPSAGSIFESTWTAPDEGTGEVTFYSSGIAGNGAAGAAGDGTAVNTLSISEGDPNSTADVSNGLTNITILGNPVSDVLQLSIDAIQAADFSVQIADRSGKIVDSLPVQLTTGSNRIELEVNDLATGIYFVQLIGQQGVTTMKVMKQ